MSAITDPQSSNPQNHPQTAAVRVPDRDSTLTTFLLRLEAATSRLEDIASSAITFDQGTPQLGDATNGASPASPKSTTRQALPASRGASASTVTPASVKQPLPPAIEAFDNLLNTELKAWRELSDKAGGVIAEQAQAVVRAFKAERQFLLVTTKAKKPDMGSPALMDAIEDIQQEMSKADDIRQGARQSPLKDNLAMVGDGLQVLGWVMMDSKPADFAKELFGGAQMFGNKVLKENKDKDRAQVDWVRSFYQLFNQLISYIREFHATGVKWNASGVDCAEAVREVKSGDAATSTSSKGTGAPPPPPPPPPPLPGMPGGGSSAKKAPDMGAVFNQLNQGEAITSGLKKVDKSQMTHKNPSLRASSTVPQRQGSQDSLGSSKSPAPSKKPKPETLRTKKPPKKELDGNKWIIDNFDSPSEPVQIEASIQHSILISRCKNTTLRIVGKANAISVDNSTRTSLIVDSLVSSVDVIKCPNFALQVLGSVPTLLLDQVDGATVYLSHEGTGLEVFTSKCTSVNVNLPPPKGQEEGDFSEHPLPEQIRSYVKNGRLVSEIVEHAG